MVSIGFSTGALAFHDYAKALEMLEPTRADSVELSALRSIELTPLLNALPALLTKIKKRYRYISFHAPTDFEDERSVVEQLLFVANLGLNVVVHPDTIRDASAWRILGSRLCLENMDSRKLTGRSAEELGPFFDALPEAKLCFDIAHARQVDTTMTEASRILSVFGRRLAQVHISEINSIGKHFGISFAAQKAYQSFGAVMSKVPIILESVIDGTKIQSEISLVEAILRRSHYEVATLER